MKTVSENANRNVVLDKTSNKKGTRKFLQTLQPSGGDKENLVGIGRFNEKSIDKMLKPQVKTEIEVKPKESKSVIEKVNPALYKQLIIEDLTSTAGPSENYWKVIAERRRLALEDVINQNVKLHAVVIALEEENASCKKLLEETTDIVNILKEMINEDDDDDKSVSIDNPENTNNDSSTDSE